MRNHMTSRIRAEITSADNSRLLSLMNEAGIDLTNVVQTDELTVQVSFFSRDLEQISKIAQRHGAQIKIHQKTGLLLFVKPIIYRPLLLLAAIIPLVLTFFLSERIIFLQVEGNQTVPSRLILETAERAGLGFGTIRRDIHSESIKNVLLEEIPVLQWVGVNTSGTVATICIREKSSADEQPEENIVSSIIASRDGVLTYCNVLKGRRLCDVGQAVKKGQLLVSGYSEQGNITQGCTANAEIMALTERSIVMVSPANGYEMNTLRDTHTCYGLLIGKKQIKFCNHSGIYDSSCDKMYVEEFWSLPGGFLLPIAWVRETITKYEDHPVTLDGPDTTWLENAASEYIVSQMVAGRILSGQTDVAYTDGLYILTGNYACQEMIGQVRHEEILK